MFRIAIAHDAITELALQRLLEAIAQRLKPAHGRQILHQRTRGTEAGCKQGAFGAGAPTILMASTMNQRLESNTGLPGDWGCGRRSGSFASDL